MSDPYVIGLRLLARRELSTMQLRERLRRRAVPEAEIARAVDRLTRDGALDDRRTALAYARTVTRLSYRGRRRVLRELHTLGIDPATAREAADVAFAELDEASLVEQALDRRLRGRRLDAELARRLHRALERLGLPSDLIRAALRRRSPSAPDGDDA